MDSFLINLFIWLPLLAVLLLLSYLSTWWVQWKLKKTDQIVDESVKDQKEILDVLKDIKGLLQEEQK